MTTTQGHHALSPACQDDEQTAAVGGLADETHDSRGQETRGILSVCMCACVGVVVLRGWLKRESLRTEYVRVHVVEFALSADMA